jgi:arylsulfatase A-like enzyme
MNFLDPHEPLSPPAPYDTQFPGKNAAFGDMLTRKASEAGGLTPEMQAHFISQYDGETMYADEWIGRILAALREEGRYRSSLIIVTSDHGELIGDHGLAGHGLEPFEPEVHVPLIVKYPGERGAGTRVRERVSTLAVFATILEAAGIAPPAGIQSIPLGRPQPVFIEDVDPLGRRVRVVYEGPHKLVTIVSPGREHAALYDLEEDPGERRPLREGKELDTLRTALSHFAAEPRRVNQAALPVIDPEKEAQLRALGYVR